MLSRAPIDLRDLSERDWKNQVLQLSTTMGWRHYFTYRSKHSPAGFPDLVFVRDRVLFVELKREGGYLSDAQKEWISALDNAGAEVYIWRPSDLDEVAGILATRKRAA